MSDQRIDERLIPPVADRRYVPPPPPTYDYRVASPANIYDERYADRSGRGTVWTALLLAAVIIVGGLIYFGHRSETASTRLPPATTGSASQSEPRPVPQVPVPPAPPIRAQ
jgi:hypothetical protein